MMKRPILALSVAVLVAACAETPVRYDVPPPRMAGQLPASSDATGETEVPEAGAAAGDSDASTVSGGMTRLASPPRVKGSLQRLDWSARFPDNDALVVSLDAVPLKDFINYSFGELLKTSYVIAQELPGLDEPITLNLEKPVSSRAYFRMIEEMLDSRKIGITFKEGVFYLHPASGKALGTIPIGFGSRPQDVPASPGAVMQIVPLRYGINASIERTILDLVSVQVKTDLQQNALFITGDREAVLRALDVVTLLDQPANRSREVAIVNLNYMGSREAAEQLVTLLGNEGVVAGIGRGDGMNVALVPLERLGAMVIFAGSPELLQRVDHWIRQLDKPNQGPEERYFIYHPRHARAADLGESLAPLLGGVVQPQAGNLARDTRSALGAATAADTRTRSATTRGDGETGAPSTGQFVTQDNVLRRNTTRDASATTPLAIKGENVTVSVDPRSNSLIFYTTGERYQALLPMVRRLDVPPKQVLLEATIAEVTLTGEFAYGVEFAFTNGNFSGGTLGNLGLPDGGLALNYISSITDQFRLKLSATNSLVNVLSNPTLIVRDGVQASISVGNDVPTIGATASDPIQSDTQITQILYRKTGLDLRIRPTINAQGLVVMEIEQSISNTVPGSSSVEGAPTFFERAVTTEVVARSGQSILLAGLISERQNDSTSKVPGFADIPGVGWLFRSDSKGKERTELVVLITPRIIDDPSEWGRIRAGMAEAFDHLRLPPDDSRSTACPDSDRDGICDTVDKCSPSLPGARVDARGCEVGETSLPGVRFTTGSDELTNDDRVALDEVAAVLVMRPEARAQIRGFSSDHPDAQRNLDLAQRRADAVRSYLAERGVSPDALSARAHGDYVLSSVEGGPSRFVSIVLEGAPSP